MAEKKLLYIAETESGDNYWVYKKGNSFYINSPNGYEHLCHTSVTGQEKIKSEILLVFKAKVTGFKTP